LTHEKTKFSSEEWLMKNIMPIAFLNVPSKDLVQSEFGHAWASMVLDASRYSTEDSTGGDTLRF
jgi:hypothetical protein